MNNCCIEGNIYILGEGNILLSECDIKNELYLSERSNCKITSCSIGNAQNDNSLSIANENFITHLFKSLIDKIKNIKNVYNNLITVNTPNILLDSSRKISEKIDENLLFLMTIKSGYIYLNSTNLTNGLLKAVSFQNGYIEINSADMSANRKCEISAGYHIHDNDENHKLIPFADFQVIINTLILRETEIVAEMQTLCNVLPSNNIFNKIPLSATHFGASCHIGSPILVHENPAINMLDSNTESEKTVNATRQYTR